MSKGIEDQVPEGWNTRTMLGRKVGRSVSVIKRMEREGLIAPTGEMPAGSLAVKLYADADIPAIRALVRKRKPGRPRSSAARKHAQTSKKTANGDVRAEK